MTNETKTGAVREAVGCFIDAKSVEDAIAELQAAGFQHAEISLLAGEHTVRQSLGHLYTEINEDADEPNAPRTAFVAKESLGDAAHAALGAFFFTGVTAAAGVLVATAGAFGSALLAAAAGVGAFGGVGAALAAIIDKSQAEYLEEQLDRGHLLLFVRTLDAPRETKAMEILSNHASLDPHVIEVSDDGRSSV